MATKVLPTRSGLPTMYRLTRWLCRKANQFAPLLLNYFAEEEAFVLAYKALMLACNEFVLEAEPLLEEGH